MLPCADDHAVTTRSVIRLLLPSQLLGFAKYLHLLRSLWAFELQQPLIDKLETQLYRAVSQTNESTTPQIGEFRCRHKCRMRVNSRRLKHDACMPQQRQQRKDAPVNYPPSLGAVAVSEQCLRLLLVSHNLVYCFLSIVGSTFLRSNWRHCMDR